MSRYQANHTLTNHYTTDVVETCIYQSVINYTQSKGVNPKPQYVFQNVKV